MIQISSEHDYTVGSEQYRWIETDLSMTDRNKTPFLVRVYEYTLILLMKNIFSF